MYLPRSQHTTIFAEANRAMLNRRSQRSASTSPRLSKWNGWAVLLWTLVATIVLAGPAASAAQGTSDSSRGALYSLHQSERSHSNATTAAPSMLRRTISVNLEGVSFKHALHEVARRGGFGLSYSSSRVPTKKVVSINVESGSVAEVLEALVEDTSLKVLVSPRREILVVEENRKSALLKDRASSQRFSDPKARVQPLSTLGTSAPRFVGEEDKQVTITGTVTSAETGNPLPGVNIVVENTNIGTATDGSGEYTLDQVPEDAEALVFSSVGFVTKREPIDGRTTIDVALDPDVASMGEVVVMGYGTQQRGDVTGAVSSVDVEELQSIPVTSFEESLQGKIPGVKIQQISGEPGASPQVKVRGTGSITAGNNPLYVVDGLPISRNTDLQGNLFRRRAAFTPPSSNPLSAINSNDIQSIEVLKDASSAAIYGSRGSNGVVIVTTKKGNQQQDSGPAVQFNSYIGRQQVANKPDLMNAEEIIEYTKDSRNNNYIQKYNPLDQDSPNYNPQYDPNTNEGRPDDDGFVLIPEKYVNYDGETDTDWLDLVLSPAAMASTNLSVAGGSEDVSYYVSGGYLNQQGTIEGSGYQRYSLRANVEATPYERLQVGTNLNLSVGQQDRLPAGSPYFARPPGIIYSAMVHSPVVEPYDDEGPTRFNQLNGQSYLAGGTTSASNPLAIMNAINEDLENHRTFGNVYAEYEFIDGFTFKTSFAADLIDYTRSFYRGNDLLYRTSKEPQPYAQSSSSQSFNWVSENTLNYSGTFGDDHELTATAGFTAQREQSNINSVIARNFPDDDVQTINAGQVTDGTSRIEGWSLLSYLGRVNYSYLDRYLLTATIRADQSSRFGPENRTGVFPSVSFGWNAHEEPFMDGVDVVSNLKPRLSYGVTGNFLVPNYASYSLLRKESYNFGGEVETATVPATLGDKELTWETTSQVNAGLDVGFFDSRLYVSADYYYSRTSDLLLNVTLPSAVGYKDVLTNIGVVENQGLELAVTSYNFTGDGFTWQTDLNFATNQNEVLELGGSGDPILSPGGAGIRHITRVGDPIGSYYGYVVDGIYQSEEDIENAPDDRLAPDPQPGDFRFKDINGDGEITADDRTVTGNYQPDFTYGITNSFSYKNLDLSIFIQGVEGREILNLTARHLKNGEANFNSYGILDERWRSPQNPGNGEVPRADRQTGIHGNNNRPSSYQVEDGSYIRLRNVTLGYEMPSRLLSGVLNQARIYVSGKNLITLTDYIGFNPEVNNQAQSSLTPGEDYGAYPISRTYTFGVDLRF
jgi:TonB-linked SusC/RagA family outer membrane protein